MAPAEADYTIIYARALMKSGRNSEAQDVLQEFLKNDPDNQKVMEMLQSF